MSDLRKCWNCSQVIEGEFWHCYDCHSNAILDGSTESWNISRFLGMVHNDLLTEEEFQVIVDAPVGPKILEELIVKMDRKCLANFLAKPRIMEAIREAAGL